MTRSCPPERPVSVGRWSSSGSRSKFDGPKQSAHFQMIHDTSVRDDRPDARRRLPSVNALLELASVSRLLERAPRVSVVEAVRAAIDAARVSDGAPRDEAAWLAAVDRELSRIVRPSLRP